MRCHTVSLEILISKAEMGTRRSLLACARDARYGIYDDRGLVIDKAEAHGGRCGKRSCRRIATGATDDGPLAFLALLRRGGKLFGEQLRQAEGGALKQFGLSMRNFVPLLVNRRVF